MTPVNASTAIERVVYTVTKLVAISEPDIMFMHFGDPRFTYDDLFIECQVIAVDRAYDEFAPLINDRLGSAYGFQWGKLIAERLSEGQYLVASRVECFSDEGESLNEFIEYIERRLSNAFDGDPTVDFYRTDL